MIASLIESLHGLHSKTVDVDFAVSVLRPCSVIRRAQLGHWSGRSSKRRLCALGTAVERVCFSPAVRARQQCPVTGIPHSLCADRVLFEKARQETCHLRTVHFAPVAHLHLSLMTETNSELQSLLTQRANCSLHKLRDLRDGRARLGVSSQLSVMSPRPRYALCLLRFPSHTSPVCLS